VNLYVRKLVESFQFQKAFRIYYCKKPKYRKHLLFFTNKRLKEIFISLNIHKRTETNVYSREIMSDLIYNFFNRNLYISYRLNSQ
jgi:hypothetical protein